MSLYLPRLEQSDCRPENQSLLQKMDPCYLYMHACMRAGTEKEHWEVAINVYVCICLRNCLPAAHPSPTSRTVYHAAAPTPTPTWHWTVPAYRFPAAGVARRSRNAMDVIEFTMSSANDVCDALSTRMRCDAMRCDSTVRL